MSSDDVKKLKVPELKEELGKLGLSVSGNKAELVARLELHYQQTKKGEIDDPDADLAPPASRVSAAINSEIPVESKSLLKDLSHPTKNGVIIQKAENVTITLPTKHTEGLSSDNRLKERAARFGLPIQAANLPNSLKSPNSGTNDTPISSRPAGKQNILSSDSSLLDIEKLKRRQERFGLTTSPLIQQLDEEDKKRRRAERFGIASNDDDNDDERRKRRADRFGIA